MRVRRPMTARRWPSLASILFAAQHHAQASRLRVAAIRQLVLADERYA
jgi:hypothetical protein